VEVEYFLSSRATVCHPNVEPIGARRLRQHRRHALRNSHEPSRHLGRTGAEVITMIGRYYERVTRIYRIEVEKRNRVVVSEEEAAWRVA